VLLLESPFALAKPVPRRGRLSGLNGRALTLRDRAVALTSNPRADRDVNRARAEEYGAYYVPHRTGPGADDYVVDHSTYVYVMDPEGKFVRAFDSGTSGDRIAHALHKLFAMQSSKGVSK
jgi:protein SCO1